MAGGVGTNFRNVSVVALSHTAKGCCALAGVAIILLVAPAQADGISITFAAQKIGPPPRSHIAVCTDDSDYLAYLQAYVASHLDNKFVVVDGKTGSQGDSADVTAVYVGRPLKEPSDNACVAGYPALAAAVSQVLSSRLNLPFEPGFAPPKPSFSSAIKYDPSEQSKIAFAAFCYVPARSVEACGPPTVAGLFNAEAGSTAE